MAKKGRRTANSLMALSSAAVLTVYAAGYTRTKSAADRLEGTFRAARPAIPRPSAEVREVKFEQPLVTAPAASPAPVSAVAPEAAAPVEKPATAEKSKIVAEAIPAPAANAKVPTPSSPAPAVEAPANPAAATPLTATSAPAAARAPEPDPYKAVITAAAGPWKDGSYSGWGSCRHGDMEVTVKIVNGKIVDAPVTNCQTRYSCDIIDKLPPLVVKRQSQNVDYIGGATQSTDAYYWAVVVALGKAH